MFQYGAQLLNYKHTPSLLQSQALVLLKVISMWTKYVKHISVVEIHVVFQPVALHPQLFGVH